MPIWLGVWVVDDITFGPINALMLLGAIICLGAGVVYVLGEDRDIF